MLWIKKKKNTCIITKEKHKEKGLSETTTCMEHFLFLRGYFRVQRNLFNYL